MKHLNIFRILTVLWMIFVQGEARAADLSEPEIEKAIQVALSQRHPTEGAAWWQGLGSRAPQVIIKIYGSDTNIYHRVRLIEALGFYDQSEAMDFLKRETEKTPDDVVRNAGIKSVARSGGERELDFVSQFLKNSDPQTRLAAAQAVAGIVQRQKSARAEEILQNYRTGEKATWILGRLDSDREKEGRASTLRSGMKREGEVLDSRAFGLWKGYLISEDASSEKGLKSEEVQIEIRMEPIGRLGYGVLQKGTVKLFEIARLTGKADRIIGKCGPSPCEGTLRKLKKGTLLEFWSEEPGTKLILRK